MKPSKQKYLLTQFRLAKRKEKKEKPPLRHCAQFGGKAR